MKMKELGPRGRVPGAPLDPPMWKQILRNDVACSLIFPRSPVVNHHAGLVLDEPHSRAGRLCAWHPFKTHTKV